MKICTRGSSAFFAGQIDRIEAGFVALGHEITDHYHEADLIYINNPPFTQVIRDKLAGNVRGKLIFTVLDIPEHLFPRFDIAALKTELEHADAVCVISKYVQSQVKQYLRMDSHAIYQPIKPVTYNPQPRDPSRSLFVHVGRRSDSNKRFHLGVAALQLLGVHYQQLALVGNEPAGWGDYLGVLKDEHLNDVYNHVDFALTLGRIEGISLPTVEAMAAGVIPVVCNDMTTRKELLPPDLFPEYNDVESNPQSVARFIADFMNDRQKMDDMKMRLRAHFEDEWERKMSPVGVASRILDVYQSIT